MESLLESLYYDPKSSCAYSGINALHKEAKKRLPSLTKNQVQEWLSEQYTYTVHKPARRHFPRNKVFVNGPGEQFQIDLADMVSIAEENDGYKYLLTCIDVFSKYAWAIPVKNKGSDEIVRAFKQVLNDKKPRKVQSDQEKEFLNLQFQRLLKDNNIRFFTSKNQEIKCSVVERFNRTIKTKIWKYFSHRRTHRYIDVIEELVEGYNSSYHRSIKMAPNDVCDENKDEVKTNLYGNLRGNIDKPIFNVGDKVRVSKIKGTFEKGYLPNWSEEVFFVRKVIPRIPTVYILEDYGGEDIEGMWYDKELQKVKVDKYWIEKIIKRRKNQVLVKWSGYPEKFNSWIDKKELISYG